MPLTVTEKAHWRDRIAERVGRRIEAIRSAHPAVFERVEVVRVLSDQVALEDQRRQCRTRLFRPNPNLA